MIIITDSCFALLYNDLWRLNILLFQALKSGQLPADLKISDNEGVDTSEVTSSDKMVTDGQNEVNVQLEDAESVKPTEEHTEMEQDWMVLFFDCYIQYLTTSVLFFPDHPMDLCATSWLLQSCSSQMIIIKTIMYLFLK